MPIGIKLYFRNQKPDKFSMACQNFKSFLQLVSELWFFLEPKKFANFDRKTSKWIKFGALVQLTKISYANNHMDNMKFLEFQSFLQGCVLARTFIFKSRTIYNFLTID